MAARKGIAMKKLAAAVEVFVTAIVLVYFGYATLATAVPNLLA
jgi:hypothetical protein